MNFSTDRGTSTVAVTALLIIFGCNLIGCSKPKTDQQIKISEARSDQTYYITVRITPDAKPETIAYLAKFVDAPSSLNFNHVWLQAQNVERVSPGTAVSDEKSHDLNDLQTTVRPQRKMSVSDFLKYEMGSDNEQARDALKAANPKLRFRWDDFVTTNLNMPYTTSYQSFPLRSKTLADAQAIATKLLQLDSAVLVAEASAGYQIVPHWALAGTSSDICPGTKGAAGWPLRTLPSQWSAFKGDVTKPAVVGIVDTGLAPDDPRFVFWTNPAPGTALTNDPATSSCVDDEHGCNFVNPRLPPIDDCQVQADFNHGTHIAGLVSARLSNQTEELDKRIQLMVLKVGDPKGQILPGAVSDAIQYAFVRNANILNLSLTGPSSSTITSQIDQMKSMLFVAASGNPASGQGIDLDDPRLDNDTGFPAKLTSRDPNVISVAAHDGSGKLLCFSNYGQYSVDLTAPGFSIESTVSEGKTRVLSGTSQSAAMVSLAAALLFSRGLTTAEAIKHRILATTDFDPDLKGKVFSAGGLNITRALDFHHDLIQLQDGTLLSGELLSPQKISVAEQTNDLALRLQIYRVICNYSSDPQKKIQVTALIRGKFVHYYSSSIGEVTFKSARGVETFSSDKLSDIIPRQGG